MPLIEVKKSDDSYDVQGEEKAKKICTERSLPHDSVIVGGRFLRAWGVDIRSMLIKSRGDREGGRGEEKKPNKPREDREGGAQRGKEAK